MIFTKLISYFNLLRIQLGVRCMIAQHCLRHLRVALNESNAETTLKIIENKLKKYFIDCDVIGWKMQSFVRAETIAVPSLSLSRDFLLTEWQTTEPSTDEIAIDRLVYGIYITLCDKRTNQIRKFTVSFVGQEIKI